MASLIKIRRDTKSNWENVNPILEEGEQAYTTDIGKLKIGNGVDRWADIGYIKGDVTGSIYNYKNKTEDYTAIANDWVDVNTTNGSFIVTLPANPNENDTIVIFDSVGKCGTNSLTIARNGSTIMAVDEDLEIDEDNTRVELKFTANDWRIV